MGATWADGRTLDVVPAEGLLSPRNAARWLDVSRSTIYVLMADGDVPYIRLGNQRRIKVSDLEALVARLDEQATVPMPTMLNAVGGTS